MSRYTPIGGAGHVTALRRFLIIVTCMLYVYGTMVKPLEKSIKFWDGRGLLRLVELYRLVRGAPETEIEQ